MISLYGLFVFLLTAEAIHAQGDKNDGNGVNHASGSKDATSLPLGTTPTTLPTTLQGSNTPDQNGASSSADLQSGKECKGGHRIRKHPVHVHSNNHNRNRLPSTSHDPHQSNEMPPPIRIKKSEEILYNQIWKTDQCHLSNPLVGSEEKSAAQCMSSRPPKLMIPYESMIQMYLSRPGRHNPYVPEVTDYIILEEEYIVVMEYVGEGWATLYSYMDDNGRPGIVDAREIIKTILDAVLFLRQQGVMHDDLHDENVMYNEQTGKVKLLDFGMSRILSEWEEEKSLQLKLSDSQSAASQSKAEIEELQSMRALGKLIYSIINGRRSYIEDLDYGRVLRRLILPDSDSI
ncbi:hypothetical protein BASA83_011539 [Batrachochytrium salamandrivorans]|nr:hypothetical protein BASA83_011539 [Batrachochytrium salamandrivorans]